MTPKKRDGHSDREASEASRPVRYREFTVRSFVRSVPCSHRALQSATDSAPLTPLQRASPLRSVTAPPLARKTESNATPTKYRGRWLERNGAIAWWLFGLGAESAGCPIVSDWLRALRARAVMFFEHAHRRRDASRPSIHHRGTTGGWTIQRAASRRLASPRDVARLRLNKEKRVCLRGSTLVNPTARDLNKSAFLRPPYLYRPCIALVKRADYFRAYCPVHEIAKYHETKIHEMTTWLGPF